MIQEREGGVVLPPGLVAVTGANGIIGTHCVLALLKAGYAVRAIVRDPSNEAKTGFIKDAAKNINALDRLSFAAGDLLKPGSYDEAFTGCDGVIHTAAVVEVTDKTDAENKIVKPSVEGTRNVLDSLSKAESVRRFIHTSSCAAVQSFEHPDDYVFTEKDWNTWSTIENGDPYGYGKTEAEKSVWEEFNEGEFAGCEVVSVNPGVVLGPVFCKAHTKSSCALVRQIMYNNTMINYNCTFVDARDVAAAFGTVKALQTPEAAGERFLLLDGKACNTMDLIPLAQRAYPDCKLTAYPMFPPWKLWLILSLGSLPGIGSMVISEYDTIMMTRFANFSNEKSKTVLGIGYRPLAETVADTIESMKQFIPLKK